MLTVYGIPNCQSVKKALALLTDRGVEHVFINFKKTPLTSDQIASWLEKVPASILVNRRGTSWRQLSDDEKAAAEGHESLLAPLVAKPTLIKRPIVEWPDGHVTTGLDAFLAEEALS